MPGPKAVPMPGSSTLSSPVVTCTHWAVTLVPSTPAHGDYHPAVWPWPQPCSAHCAGIDSPARAPSTMVCGSVCPWQVSCRLLWPIPWEAGAALPAVQLPWGLASSSGAGTAVWRSWPWVLSACQGEHAGVLAALAHVCRPSPELPLGSLSPHAAGVACPGPGLHLHPPPPSGHTPHAPCVAAPFLPSPAWLSACPPSWLGCMVLTVSWLQSTW